MSELFASFLSLGMDHSFATFGFWFYSIIQTRYLFLSWGTVLARPVCKQHEHKPFGFFSTAVYFGGERREGERDTLRDRERDRERE